MSDKPTTARISLAAILLRNAGFPDVAAFLMAKEKRAAHGTGKRKQVLYTERGERIELYRDVVKRMSDAEEQ